MHIQNLSSAIQVSPHTLGAVSTQTLQTRDTHTRSSEQLFCCGARELVCLAYTQSFSASIENHSPNLRVTSLTFKPLGHDCASYQHSLATNRQEHACAQFVPHVHHNDRVPQHLSAFLWWCLVQLPWQQLKEVQLLLCMNWSRWWRLNLMRERQREISCIHTLVELIYGPTLLVASSHVGIVHVMTGLDVMPVI